MWGMIDDDFDEQGILQVDGCEIKAHDRELEIGMGDTCAAEFVIPLGLVSSPAQPSEGSR